jgi:hypothetical protein
MIICDNCGMKNEENNKFCIYCGNKLELPKEEMHIDLDSTHLYVTPPSFDEILIMRKRRAQKLSKRCYILAIISFALAIIAICVSIPLIYITIYSVEAESAFINTGMSYRGAAYTLGVRYYIDNTIKMLISPIGLLIIACSIISFIFALISKILKRKVIHSDIINKYTKKGGLFAIFGLILSIIAIILSIISASLPFLLVNFLNNNRSV